MNNWNTQKFTYLGREHAKRQSVCQDALTELKSPELVISVVADGVGSLSNSHMAADAATKGAIEWFTGNLESLTDPESAKHEIRTRLLPKLQADIRNRAQERGVLIETMDCNFAFACILPKAGFAVWGVLGDCAVCVFHKENTRVLSGADAVSANGTDAIVHQENADNLRLMDCTLSDGKLLGFMVMTDGLEGEIYWKSSRIMRRRAADYFNAMLLPTDPEREEAIVRMLTGLPDSFYDDISLGIISAADRRELINLDQDPTWLCGCGTRNPIDTVACARCQSNLRQMYSGQNFGGDPILFFRKLNRDPAREHAILDRSESGAYPSGRRRKEDLRRSPGRRSGREQTAARAAEKAAADAYRSEAGKSSAPDRIGTAGKQTDGGADADRINGQTADRKKKTVPIRNAPDEAESGGKTAGDTVSQPRPSMIAVLLLINAVLLISVLGFLFGQQIQISSMKKQFDEHCAVCGQQETAAERYVVDAYHVNLWQVVDGEKQRKLERLETGCVLERLDDQEIEIEDAVFIHVRTTEGVEGWCNLGSLVLQTSEDTP